MFTSLLKGMIKNVDEQPDENIHKMKSGRVLSTGASVSHSWYGWMCSPTWMLSEPSAIGILWRHVHIDMIN